MYLNLQNRDITGILIAFIKFNEDAFYCMADVEYWIAEYWDGYVNLNQGTLEELYFEYLKKFELNYPELSEEYKKLPQNDSFNLEGNKPKIYIDFNEKYFRSYFFEQELERRVPNDWTGEYGVVTELIPDEFNYWKT